MGAYLKNAPEDDHSNNVHRRRRGCQGLGKGGEDDHDQLEAVHALAADNIGESAEAELADDGTGRRGELDGRVGGGGHLADAGVVDDAEHEGQEGDGEDVVRVGEKADASDHDGAYVVPPNGGSVDLGECEAPPLVDVLDVSKVIVLSAATVLAKFLLFSRLWL